jgi:hypothetical protein
MVFEPEWLYLHELLDLLGPSPDMVVVESRFRRALDEEALEDRDKTPAEVWRRRFEEGDEINWVSGTMVVPWVHCRGREWAGREIRPQFSRAAWLNVFSDFVPGATREISAPRPQPNAEIEQKVKRWYRDRVANWPDDQKPPSEAEDVKAAGDEFPGVPKLRGFVRLARKDCAPEDWKKAGPRPSRKPPTA